MHEPGEAGGGEQDRHRDPLPEHRRRDLALRHVRQPARVEANALERRPVLAQRHLAARAAVDELEDAARDAAAGEPPQVVVAADPAHADTRSFRDRAQDALGRALRRASVDDERRRPRRRQRRR